MRFLYSGLLVAIEANGSAATKESGGGRGSGPGILHLRVHGPAMSLSPSPSRPAPLAADSDACELRVNFPAFFWHDASESCLPQQVALNLLRWSLSITPCERASEAAVFRGPRRNEVRGRASGSDSRFAADGRLLSSRRAGGLALCLFALGRLCCSPTRSS
jgi:hypothetical protein